MKNFNKSALASYQKCLYDEIKRRRPLIYIQTDDYITEEKRLKSIFSNDDVGISKSIDPVNVNMWSFERGKRSFWCNSDTSQLNLPSCIEGMLLQNEPSILIIRGLYFYMGGLNGCLSEITPNLISLLYDFYYDNCDKSITERSMIIIESPRFEIPHELSSCFFTIETPLPNEIDILEELGLDEIDRQYNPDVDETLKDYQIDGKPYIFSSEFFQSDYGDCYNQNKKKLVAILKGMRIREIRTLLSYNDFNIKDVDLDKFRIYKEQMVRDSGLLRVEKIDESQDNKYYELVGDIDGLMAYIEREKAIIDNWINYNQKMPMPKGLLLVGPPGCGKSETSKAIASKLEMPLYSLDMGRLLGGLMGASEHNFENAIAIAEAAQPCVLRIDEIEKAFAGSGVNDNSDTLTRIVGFFLTWMQERKSLVYIVATANNLNQLRPEFLRKGRWDEIFYLSYPKADGMIKILNSCLKRYGLSFDNINSVEKEINKFYENNPSVNISGAEIYDLIEQIYKEKFKLTPTSCNNIISSELFSKGLKLFSHKKSNPDIEKIIDDEILELKKESILHDMSEGQKKQVIKALNNKYSDDAINNLINDELVSYEINYLHSGGVGLLNKDKIKQLLRSKYDKDRLIKEEFSNIELNSCLQSGIMNCEREKEIRHILRCKYETNKYEETYRLKGYKPASDYKLKDSDY